MVSLILKIILNTLKLCAFSVVVLVASHLIQWHGKTISDQVKTTLSSEEPKAWMKRAERDSQTMVQDAKNRAGKAVGEAPNRAKAWIQAQKESADSNLNPRSQKSTDESISDTEKSELSSLIQD